MKILEIIANEDITGFDDLPLFHTTKTEKFKAIAKTNTLKANYCNTLKNKCNFFFYGRAMYSNNDRKNRNVEDYAFLPVAICLSSDLLMKHNFITHIFDTGKFGEDHFNGKLASNITMNDITLGMNKDNIHKYVKHFYLTNNNYIEDSVRKERSTDLQLSKDVLRHLNNKKSTSIDGRSRTVEVAINGDINLDQKVVLFIHNKMHRQGFIIDFLSHLENNNVPYEVIKYYTVEQVSPLSAYSILNGRVRQYMEENYGC